MREETNTIESLGSSGQGTNFESNFWNICGAVIEGQNNSNLAYGASGTVCTVQCCESRAVQPRRVQHAFGMKGTGNFKLWILSPTQALTKSFKPCPTDAINAIRYGIITGHSDETCDHESKALGNKVETPTAYCLYVLPVTYSDRVRYNKISPEGLESFQL
jgi:hypothetical protein